MSQAVFFPYATLPQAIEAEWELRGADFAETPTKAFRLVEDMPRDGRIVLAVSSPIDDALIARALPESERAEPPVQVLLVVRSPSSRLRTAVPMVSTEGSVLTGEIELPGSMIHGQVDAFVVVVRTAHGAPTSGYASHKGAILGTSETKTIELEEPPSPPGGYLEVSYEDFRLSGSNLRRANSDKLFAIDLEGEVPTIWLNDAIPDLARVTQSRARRGLPRRVRDATFDTITTQVWTSLIATAVSALAIALADDVEYGEALDSLDDWQSRTIHFWAERVFPELSASQAVEAVCHSASGPERLPMLFERVTLATQGWSQSAGAFDGLVRVLVGEGV
jgi:hypothetical protein